MPNKCKYCLRYERKGLASTVINGVCLSCKNNWELILRRKSPHNYSQKCEQCGEVKTLKAFNFVWNSKNRSKSKHSTVCRTCEQRKIKEIYCLQCEKLLPAGSFSRKRRKGSTKVSICKRHEANKEARSKTYKRNLKDYTPLWADKSIIKKFYEKARELERETGIKYHVDHFIPLKGKTVTGLHTHNNLQVIPARDNLKKGNSFDFDPDTYILDEKSLAFKKG